MSELKEIQSFLTRYLRDAGFRDDFQKEGKEAQLGKMDLSKKGKEMLDKIDLTSLDGVADGIISERYDKRKGEFTEFIDHLSVFYDPILFFRQFDRAFPSGLTTRALELDRLLSFSMDFVSYHQFPQYLIELARLGYYYSKVADTPLKPIERAVEYPADQNFQFYYHVQLKEPYQIVQAKYDILGIAKAAPNPNASYAYNPVTLFIQKEWGKAKTTRILYANEVFSLDLLVNGPKAVSELLASSPAQDYAYATDQLLGLYKSGIVEFTIPNHFPIN